MSRLIDIIEKAGLQSAPPLGFGAAAGKEQATPDLVLIESVSAEQIGDAASATSAADAIVVDSSDPMDGAQGIEDRVWGVRSSSFTLEQSTNLLGKGCDFVVFKSLETHAAVLNDEELGVIAEVPADMDEESVRALMELQVDGVLFTPPLTELPLTIKLSWRCRPCAGSRTSPSWWRPPTALTPPRSSRCAWRASTRSSWATGRERPPA